MASLVLIHGFISAKADQNVNRSIGCCATTSALTWVEWKVLAQVSMLWMGRWLEPSLTSF